MLHVENMASYHCFPTLRSQLHSRFQDSQISTWDHKKGLNQKKDSPFVCLKKWMHPNVCFFPGFRHGDPEEWQHSVGISGWISPPSLRTDSRPDFQALMPSAAAQQSWRLFWEIGLSWPVWSPQLHEQQAHSSGVILGNVYESHLNKLSCWSYIYNHMMKVRSQVVISY